MRLLGFEIRRVSKAAPASYSSVPGSGGGWYSLIREPWAGAWQRNVELRAEDVATFCTVFACVTLIAGDVSKLRPKLIRRDGDGLWVDSDSDTQWSVLKRPNHYQNRIRFFETWLLSKLLRGNTYVLKQRDERGRVSALYVLDPTRVRVVVAQTGDVYYQLNPDNLSDVTAAVTVPATEIIHDLANALYHPLVGISPIAACGLAATQGLRIQATSAELFANRAQPSGVLESPAAVDEEVAKRIQQQWQQGFTGPNAGKVAVLGNDLKYKPLTISPEDAQLIEQLKWTSETVCSTFHVPPFKVAIGPAPANHTVEALSIQYYSGCLQALIESIELCLDEGLEMPPNVGIEFDLDALMRMDTLSLTKAASDAVGSGVVAINEARRRFFNLPPVPGGDTPFLQQQYWPVSHLATRPLPQDPINAPVEIAAPKSGRVGAAYAPKYQAGHRYEKGAVVRVGPFNWLALSETDAVPGTDEYTTWRFLGYGNTPNGHAEG